MRCKRSATGLLSIQQTVYSTAQGMLFSPLLSEKLSSGASKFSCSFTAANWTSKGIESDSLFLLAPPHTHIHTHTQRHVNTHIHTHPSTAWLRQQVFWAENKRNRHRLQINEIHLLHNNGCILLAAILWQRRVGVGARAPKLRLAFLLSSQSSVA